MSKKIYKVTNNLYDYIREIDERLARIECWFAEAEPAVDEPVTVETEKSNVCSCGSVDCNYDVSYEQAKKFFDFLLTLTK